MFLFAIFVAPVIAKDVIDIFGAAHCSSTSRFFENQLIPFLRWIHRLPEDLEIRYHPIPKYYIGKIQENNTVNYCTRGVGECKVSLLQVCILEILKENIFQTVGCTQGKGKVEALDCLGELKDRIVQCSKSQMAEKLLAEQYDLLFSHPEKISWIPWIYINGVRNKKAEKRFLQQICRLESLKKRKICK